MRSRRARSMLVTPLLAVTVALGLPASGGQEALALPVVPQLIFSEDLGDGRILTRFTGGVTVVASAGSEVLFETIPLSDVAGGLSVGIRPPDYNDSQVGEAAARYRAAGRSPEKDVQALGYSQGQAKAQAAAARSGWEAGTIRPLEAGGGKPGEIYDTGCAEIDKSVFWRGCFRRYHTEDKDPRSWYTADESQGTGHGKGAWYLRTGRTDHRYKRAEVVQWQPANDVTAG